MRKHAMLTSANIAVLLCGLATPALGQAIMAGADQTADDAPAAGEIIVTATRRPSPLSDVPIAMSAVSAQSLRNSGASDIRQLNQLAPSLLVSSTGSEANGAARIRGVGTVGDNPGLESSVAVFIDGVYRSRSGAGLNDLGEIERIEVLRGPQGTLFGRNASAGLLNIVTAAPSFDFGANGEASFGNYNAWRLQGSVTGPLTSTVAARIDGVYSKRDGFYADKVNGGTINNRDRYLVRAQMLFEPSADLHFRLIGDWSKKSEACCAAVYLNDQTTDSIGGLLDPAENNIVRVLTDLGQNSAAFTQDPYSRNVYITPGRSYQGYTRDGGISLEANWDMGGVRLTSISAYRTYRNDQPGDFDYSEIDIVNRDSYDRRFNTFTQELRLQGSAFADRLDWLAGGYYAHETLKLHDDLHFGSQYGRFAACRIVTGSSLSFAYDPAASGCVAPGLRPMVSGALGAAGPLVLSGLDRLDGIGNVGNDDNWRQTSRNYAFFTHNIFHVSKAVDLTIGARYTHEKKNLTAIFNNSNAACIAQKSAFLPYVAHPSLGAAAQGLIGLSCQGNDSGELNGVAGTARRSEGEWTGTAVLSWKPDAQTLAYASYSRGYKAGGFNLDRAGFQGSASGLPLPLATISSLGGVQALMDSLQFAPEKVNAYEIGFKFSGQRFSLNVAAFREEFRDFQLNAFNGATYIVQNINGCAISLNGGDRDQSKFTSAANYSPAAASSGVCPSDKVGYGASSTGVEVEASVVPARYLRATMGATYARTRYRGNLTGSNFGAPLDQALRLLPGNSLSNAPEFVGTASLTWTPPLGGNDLTGLFYLDARTTSRYNTGSDLFPQKAQDGYTLVNGRIGIRGDGERWAIELWGQNIFNRDYAQVAFNAPFQEGATGAPYVDPQYPGGRQIFTAYLSEPRTYGVTVRMHF